MKKLILLLTAAVMVLCHLSSYAADRNVSKQTHLFAEKNGEKLYLDTYSCIGEKSPNGCVVFMFGGAFVRGTRDREDYIPYFEYLVERGYTVVSIDYRLGLKDIADVPDLDEEKAAGMLVKAIDMAVDDLLDATAFVLDNAGEWNIDVGDIVLNGSSTGAVSILQVEYELRNGKHGGRLPEDFRYAGIISFAEAILDLSGALNWNSAPAPIMMMHGDADRQVPYNELRFDPIGFFGSKYISEQFIRMGIPHAFYSFDNYGHEIASLPIREYWEEVGSFLKHFTGDQEQPLTVLQTIHDPMKLEVEKEFTIADFLNGNYGL